MMQNDGTKLRLEYDEIVKYEKCEIRNEKHDEQI